MFKWVTLVKGSAKTLEEVSGNEVRQMVRDSLAENYENYDKAALDEFLNVDCVDAESEALRLRLREIEKRLFESGDRFGLSSQAARSSLDAIANATRR